MTLTAIVCSTPVHRLGRHTIAQPHNRGVGRGPLRFLRRAAVALSRHALDEPR
jgi:hypothetical protein